MTYRDLRNFTEMLRALGYPKLISMESFRTPNFPLVADITVWLCARLDSDTDVPTECNTEDERVSLITTAAQFMALKMNIKLNTKRLYQSDGYAVKELLKIITVLYDALCTSNEKIEEEEDELSMSLKDYDISDRIGDLKLCRQLASDITTNGAQLYDLLGKETDLRALRQVTVGRQFELEDVELAVKSTINEVQTEIKETKELINNVSNAEANLDSKIERRRTELDRYEKRLQSLKRVRPAFLEDFSKAEEELKQLYEHYIVRYRCLTYLEQRAAEVDRIEMERMQQHLIATRHMVEQLRLEESMAEENSDFGDTDQDENKKPQRPRNKPESRDRSFRSSKLMESLNPSSSVIETSTPTTSESDSEDILLDGDEPDVAGSILGSEDDSIALEISTMEKRAPTGRKTSNQQRHDDSDDDF